MTTVSPQLSFLVAHDEASGWPRNLSAWLNHWPVEAKWLQSDSEALDFATAHDVHLLIVDDLLPPAGGMEAVRRMRRVGLATPCLYVCDHPAPRLLSDAIKLDVISVVDGDSRSDQLAAMIVRIAQRLYQVQLPSIKGLN